MNPGNINNGLDAIKSSYCVCIRDGRGNSSSRILTGTQCTLTTIFEDCKKTKKRYCCENGIISTQRQCKTLLVFIIWLSMWVSNQVKKYWCKPGIHAMSQQPSPWLQIMGWLVHHGHQWLQNLLRSWCPPQHPFLHGWILDLMKPYAIQNGSTILLDLTRCCRNKDGSSTQENR